MKVTPLGSVPQCVRVAVGEPVAVTVNDPADPAVKVVVLALVITGTAWDPALTTRLNDWLALGSIPFAAVMASG